MKALRSRVKRRLRSSVQVIDEVMKLAVFDLDHTLLPIDSGDAWSHWLVRKAGLDEEKIGAQIEAYAQAYRTGHFVPLSFISVWVACRTKAPRFGSLAGILY